MKKVLLFAIAILGTAFAYASTEMIEVAELGSMSLSTLPAWFTMKGEVKEFNKLSIEDIEKLEDADYNQYSEAHTKHLEDQIKALKEGSASKDDIAEAMKEINDLHKLRATKAEDKLKEMADTLSATITKLENANVDKNTPKFERELKAAFDSKLEEFKTLKSGGSSELLIKASQTYGDIDAGLDFAQFKPGITDIPVRNVIFKSLFNSIPLSTEFLKYTEQETVLRDAQNVAKCAEVTSTTKETIKVSSIETKVVQDTIDFCRTFIEDYSFMSERINKLLNQSIALRVDQQILLGTGAGEETFSIDSVSSEFSAANVACVLTASIQAPNLVDLISGMATQIFELGKQATFIPNVAIVNNCDWFKDVASLKDLNNNYLDARIVVIGGSTFVVTLMGMIKVVTSPIVPQNECYVLDSTKGDTVDRQETRIEVSFENKDNFVKHIGTLLGWVRFNFLVENNNANAFMKCSDVGAAITAITKP